MTAVMYVKHPAELPVAHQAHLSVVFGAKWAGRTGDVHRFTFPTIDQAKGAERAMRNGGYSALSMVTAESEDTHGDAVTEAGAKVTDAMLKDALARYANRMKGGKGDHLSPAKFPKATLRKGLSVELEHTKDPAKALEIVMDHLAEKPDYYARLEKAGLAEAWNDFYRDAEQRAYDAAMRAKRVKDTASPSGYEVKIAHPAKPGEHEVLTKANALVRRYNALVSDIRSAPMLSAGKNNAGEVHPLLRSMVLKKFGPDSLHTIEAERHYAKIHGDITKSEAMTVHNLGTHGHPAVISAIDPNGRDLIRDARAALKRVDAAHQNLISLARHYGGGELIDKDTQLPVGPQPDTAKQHNSFMHFPDREGAWKLITLLHHGGAAYRSASISDDNGDVIAKATPRSKTVSYFAESAGAFRDLHGRFRNLDYKGHVTWIPHIPRAFEERVRRLGGKVKRSGSGGGMALVFKTVEAARAAHTALAYEGHAVRPHDLPAVLLVSHVADDQTGRRVDESAAVDKIDALLREESVDEGFVLSSDSLPEAMEAAQDLADTIDDDAVVVLFVGDADADEDAARYVVMPRDQFEDGEDANDQDYTLVAVVEPAESTGFNEAVGKRRRLAARLSADRIRGRPMGGSRLRSARNAARWRLRNRGRHLLNKKTTVYRNQADLSPLSK